ncbi:FAD-dependent monooxygenase [Actinoplanes friuliensis]|uniref:FAD-binding monooxygenase n=1 Tax=Actinoplanes friuliensis DSM 7358 TaxID=1246995 RepID=U5VTV6_9ACTN|nr:FAD-dependent monooxygenase [Actinoplanes friuliensis]AGZ40242.1 FAD-binding monooxygenase [Actinoplanes friuliensis DSM 7358]
MTVLIVGAGPTGLTLAIELQSRGVPHRIVEASSGPFEGSRGKGIQPRTLEVLDDLGVLDRFLAAGADYPALRIHLPGGDFDRRMDELREPTPDVPHPNVWMVPQWRTGQLLTERLTELGGHVEYGVAVTELAGANVTLSTGETVAARYVVGADGGRSTIRAALGVGFEGDTYETQRMLIADVRLTGLPRDVWHVWPGDDGRSQRLGLCPLPGTDDWQLTAPHATSVEDILAEVAPEVTLTHVGWTSQFRANIRMVDRYRVGNVFLAGDAAHVHSPAGGQGLNTGVQDAYNLGWKLATGDDALLDTYEAERLPVAAGVLGISTRLHNRHGGDVQQAMRRDDPELQQLTLGYRGGPLADERRRQPGTLQAGDRAPDAPCSPSRIFDALRGPEPVLLAFDCAPPPMPGVRVVRVVRPGMPTGPDTLVDTDGHAHRAYDIHHPTLFLVRPDGYVGCAADSTDLESIEAYARRISPAPQSVGGR